MYEKNQVRKIKFNKKTIRNWLDSARNTQILYGYCWCCCCCEKYTTLPNQSNAIFRVVHMNFSSANAFPRLNARPLRYRVEQIGKKNNTYANEYCMLGTLFSHAHTHRRTPRQNRAAHTMNMRVYASIVVCLENIYTYIAR